MAKLKAGIVGCGGIANQKHLPILKNLGLFEAVAFCDLIEERAIQAKKDFGSDDARIYTDYHKLLEEDLDAVFVLTPNIAHAPITIAALNSGKSVMCEKPMATTFADAKAMADAAKANKKVLTIGYQNRYKNSAQYIRTAVQAGEFGEIYFAKAYALRRRGVPTWGVFLDAEKQGGGPLIDIGTHSLDLALWFMDNYDPVSVTGVTFRKLADQKNTANSWGDWDPSVFTVEDSAFGFVKMRSGATVIIESSWALNTLSVREACAQICGTLAGADTMDGLRINSVKHGFQVVEKPELKLKGVDYFEGLKESHEYREHRVFYEAVAHGAPLTVLPEQAMIVTKILEAVYESAKTGKTVYFD